MIICMLKYIEFQPTPQIIKQAGPSRQLFETVNFAFMKIFDFLVKIAVFRVFLLFLGDLRHALWLKLNT